MMQLPNVLAKLTSANLIMADDLFMETERSIEFWGAVFSVKHFV
jgi:hypothetical protein